MLKGKLKFPGDKSISHRALILASLTNGNCEFKNISTGADVESTRDCLSACGIISDRTDNTVTITGAKFRKPEIRLDCGNSGTSVRLLTGLLAGQRIEALFIGDESLSQRPMQRIINPLNKMGSDIKSTNDRLPLRLSGKKLIGISYIVPIASAQIKSAILLAGLGAENRTTIIEPLATRNHTEILLSELGADIRTNANSISISPLQKPLAPFSMTIPGDPSSAAFFAAATTILPKSELILEQISLNSSRIGFYDILKKMGGSLRYNNLNNNCGEPLGDIHITSKELHGISIIEKDIPSIIDEIPILAILATQADGKTVVQGAGELRVKECDRINAICINLKRMGAEIDEFDDGFVITGPTPLKSAKIETFGDHRIAMAFTIAGLISNTSVKLDNSDCVNISFPEFYSFLNEVL